MKGKTLSMLKAWGLSFDGCAVWTWDPGFPFHSNSVILDSGNLFKPLKKQKWKSCSCLICCWAGDTAPTSPPTMHAKCSSKTIIIKLGRVHSSPHTQTVEALHRLAVPQQEAALLSEPLQQPLCGLAPDSPEVEGPNLRTLRLHASLRATEGSMCWASVTVATERRKKKCWFSHFFSTSAAATMHIGSLCRWLVFDLFLCFFPPLPALLLLIQIQKHRNNRTLVTFGH